MTRNIQHIDKYNIRLNIKVVKQTRLEIKLINEFNELPNTTVYLKNQNEIQNVTTNSNGLFIFRNIESGEY